MRIGEVASDTPLTPAMVNSDPLGIPCLAGSGALQPGQSYCPGYGPGANLVPCLNGTGPLAPGQAYCPTATVTPDGTPFGNTAECAAQGLVWDPTLGQCVDPSGAAQSGVTTSWIPGVSNTTVLIGGLAVLALFMGGRRR